MRTTFGPPKLSVFAISVNQALDVYRVVRSEVEDDPVFLSSLRSHYELAQEPRRGERYSTIIHMGISTYIRPQLAHDAARRFGKLGDYVAQLHLAHGRGFNYARTGNPGHLTVWGHPVKLREAAVDIVRVER